MRCKHVSVSHFLLEFSRQQNLGFSKSEFILKLEYNLHAQTQNRTFEKKQGLFGAHNPCKATSDYLTIPTEAQPEPQT